MISPIISRNLFLVFLFITITVYVIGMFIPVMDVDAAQYASISVEMLQNNEFLQVKHKGLDYLDKPPLLFWLSTLSFSILGISDFAYKLPSVLASLLGIYSVFRFTNQFYNISVARLASLILACSQAVFLINNDCRTDTLLLGNVMFAVWQWALYFKSYRWGNLVLGSIGIGLAMLAKGPIGAIVPVSAIFAQVILKKKYNDLLNIRWLIGALIVAIMLFPMCWGLYQQYGFEGIRFYFWTQSFGRITGENAWKNDSGYFYFVHNFLWSFLPWSLIFIPALLYSFKPDKRVEGYSLGGFLLPFIALSFSKYKLPHYVFVTYPMAAVIVAIYIEQLFVSGKEKELKVLKWVQYFQSLILYALAFAIIAWVFKSDQVFIWSMLILFFIFTHVALFYPRLLTASRLVIITLITITGINFILNAHFYPNLLKYQGPGDVGKYILENKISGNDFYTLNESHHSLNFQANRICKSLDTTDQKTIKTLKNKFVYTDDVGLQQFATMKIRFEVVKEFPSFSVTRLNFAFLNPQKRQEEIEKTFLIRILGT